MVLSVRVRSRTVRLAAAGAAATSLVMFAVLLAVFAAAPSDAAIEQHRALLIARQAKGDFSEAGLRAMLSRIVPDAVALGMRYDPAQFRATPSVASTAGPDRDMLDILPGLTSQQAQAVNAGFAYSDQPNPAARPFFLKGASVQDRGRALGCLTQAVYYEAGFEPLDGAQAVAQVVLNRVRHPAFPKTVCGVVYEGSALRTGCQFSFTCDGSLARPPVDLAWKRARDVAERALNGFVMGKVGGATHYHTQWVAPYWAPTLTKVSMVGSQIFYRWPGDWGLPIAFRGRYAGGEKPGDDVGADLAGGESLLLKAQTAPAPKTVTLAILTPPPVIEAASAPLTGFVADVALSAIQIRPQRPERAGRMAFSNNLH